MRHLVLPLGIVLLLGPTGPAVAGSVRVPRDSPIVIGARVLQPGTVDLSKVTPPAHQPTRAPSVGAGHDLLDRVRNDQDARSLAGPLSGIRAPDAPNQDFRDV
jgi:hypothetical protein